MNTFNNITLPKGWEVKRVKEIFRIVGSGTTPDTKNENLYDDNGLNWLQTGDLNDDFIYETSKKISAKAKALSPTLKSYPIGSLVIAMYGATIGKIGLLKIETTTNQACCVLSNAHKQSVKFIFYWFLNNKNIIISLATGGGQPNINQDIVKFLQIPLPPLPVQTQIAAYLDEKTAQIDRQIALLNAKADKYRTLRRSIINQAVTQGLEPNPVLKPSGIKWIENIPQGWEVVRMKDYLLLEKGQKPTLYVDDDYTNKVPYLTMDYLRERENRNIDYVDPSTNFCVKDNELLILWDGANAGEIIKSKTGCISSTMAVIRIIHHKNKINENYLFYWLKYLEPKFKYHSSGTTIPHMDGGQLMENLYFFPPLPIQTRIAAYLDEKTAQIDAMVSNIQKQVEQLNTLRRSIIDQAVTGQISEIIE